MARRGIVAGAVAAAASAAIPAFGAVGGGIVAPTTTTITSTTRPVIVSPTTSTTTLPPTFTTTTSTSPVIVVRTTTTTTAPPTVPTTPPVVVGPTSTTAGDPPFTTPPVIALPTTSSVPGLAGPGGGVVPDVFVRGVEITQGIQDLQSRMPLVAGRRTTVRLHIGTSGGFVGAVDGALLVERAGIGDVVLHPDNGPIPPGLDRTEIDGALNFELDAALYAEGEATFTAQVWSVGGGAASIADEPDPDNNLMSEHAEFHVASAPTVWLIALEDGDGPGDPVTDVTGLLGFAQLANADLLDYLPIATVDFQAYPLPVGPGPEAADPGSWDVSLDIDVDPTANQRRTEPNLRMNEVATAGGFLDDGLVLGLFDDSVPQGAYSGWAKYGVSWNFAAAGTPAHEAAHSAGLNHVNCLGDTDGDGVPQEDEAGAIDWSHPTGLPPVCSLAPIDPDGFFGYTNYHTPVTIYSNDPAHAQAAFPFMGYRDPGWTDPYHWCRMLVTFGVPCDPASLGLPPANPFLDVDCEPEPVGPASFELDLCLAADGPAPLPSQSGGAAVTLGDGDDAGVLTLTTASFAYRVPLDAPEWVSVSGSAAVGNPSNGLGPLGLGVRAAVPELGGAIERIASGEEAPAFALRVVDGAGAPLAIVPVVFDPGSTHSDEPTNDPTGSFLSPIPLLDGAAAVELMAADGWSVSWRAEAPAANFRSLVLWSADGTTWLPVPGEVSATIEPAAAGGGSVGVFHQPIGRAGRLPGGDGVRVMVVVAADGRSASTVSEPFSAPDQATLVVIAGAPAGPVEEGDLVELTALVDDPEGDATMGARDYVIWQKRLGTPLGAEPVLQLRDLAVGVHTIDLVVTDSSGAEVTATVDVEVVARTTPTRRGEQPDPAAVAILRRASGE